MTSETCSLHMIFYFEPPEANDVEEAEAIEDFVYMVQQHLPFATTSEIEEPHTIADNHNVYIALMTLEGNEMH